MKMLLQIVLVVCVMSIYGQDNLALKGKPTALEETIPYLNQYMDDTIKYTFMVLPEQDAVSKMHFPYGMWIRNEWGLWRDSELKKFFNEYEVYQPDAMSAIIFTSYHRFLNNEPIDFKGQIERHHFIQENTIYETSTDGSSGRVIYPEEIGSLTNPEDLIEYFPINDTIIFSIGGRKGIFKKAVSVRCYGKIVGYTEEYDLDVEIVRMVEGKNISTEYSIGQVTDVYPGSCWLIPPCDWKPRAPELNVP